MAAGSLLVGLVLACGGPVLIASVEPALASLPLVAGVGLTLLAVAGWLPPHRRRQAAAFRGLGLLLAGGAGAASIVVVATLLR